jgi:hypothetical protein
MIMNLPMTRNPEGQDLCGGGSLRWIGRFQFVLLPLGALLWLFKSPRASLVFLVGALASLAFWWLHRWLVARMLTPSRKLRWFYGILGFGKLALIGCILYGMMSYSPGEVLPLTTGILLFVEGILLEAIRLLFCSGDGVR